jgi:hypothetical protein
MRQVRVTWPAWWIKGLQNKTRELHTHFTFWIKKKTSGHWTGIANETPGFIIMGLVQKEQGAYEK